MKTLLAALLLAPSIAAAAGGLPKPEIVEFQLENGLDVVYLGVHRAPLVSVQVWYHVGSKDEPSGQHGAAHMFEHLMFKGTRFVRPDQHTRMVNSLGGKVDAFTREDMTAYVDTVPRTALDFVVRLEADRMRNLLIRKDMVDAQREIVKEEKHARVDNSPVARALERFRRIAFSVHPYGFVSAGTVEDLDRLKPSDLQRFYDAYYRPNNAVLVVVGDVAEAEVRAAAQRWFGPLEKGPTVPRPARSAQEPVQKQLRKETVGSSPLGLVIGGWHIPAARSEDIFALQVLANIVSGGESSRLVGRIVRKDQSGVYASGQMLLLEDPGLFIVYGVYLKPQAGPKVEDALEEELGRLGREPVGDSELIKAKAQLSAGFIFGLEPFEALAEQIGASKLITGDAKGWVGDYEKYQAVSAADVMRVARQYLVPENLTIVVVPPAAGGQK
jgi:zinc protease